MSDLPPFKSAEDFYFATPLYSVCEIDYSQANELLRKPQRVDGFCPHCGRDSTFIYRPNTQDYLPSHESKPHHVGSAVLHCARNEQHILAFHYRLIVGELQKVGQFPSFASIALDQSKQYASVLGKQNRDEFHRAIGLAAHGIGIGSFVYLRRIFERLIDRRYKEFNESEKWDDAAFYKLRMAERVAFLKDHLPPFLVKNAKVYSILSVGIHDLNEDQCLAFFPVLRQSTILMLEEDKKKREEFEMQKELEKAIASFTTAPKEDSSRPKKESPQG